MPDYVQFIYSTFIGQIIFWVGLVVGLILIILGSFWYWRRSSLRFKAFELSLLGNGKIHIEEHKAGWFGKKSTLFGLLHWGKPKVMKMKDGRKVRDFETIDYHQTKKGKCIMVVSDPADKNLVVPLSKFRLTNEELFADMPPIDFRDAAVDSYKQVEKELKGTGERIMELAIIGLIVIAAVLAIIFVTRYAQQSLRESSQMFQANANICADAISRAIEVMLKSQPSTAP